MTTLQDLKEKREAEVSGTGWSSADTAQYVLFLVTGPK